MKYCMYCGAKLADDAAFCSRCGAKLAGKGNEKAPAKGIIQDPYAILGVSEDASDEEIGQKYHELLQKYFPDNFAQYDDPVVTEMAYEKTRGLTRAYEVITKGGEFDEDSNSGHLGKAIEYLNSGDYKMAEREVDFILNLTSPVTRSDLTCATAARIYFKTGKLVQASEFMEDAIKRNPCAEYFADLAEILLAEMENMRAKIEEEAGPEVKEGMLPKDAGAARVELEEYQDLAGAAMNNINRAEELTADTDDEEMKSVIYGEKAYLGCLTLCGTRQEREECDAMVRESMKRAENLGDHGGYLGKIAESGGKISGT